MECFICEIFRKINTDDYNTPEHVKMRKTQTLEKKINEGEEREKKDICGCQNKGVDKDHIEFLRKAELLMMSHCRKEFLHTHTHCVSRFVLRKTLQLNSDYCGKHLSNSTFTHLSISTCLHTSA